MIAAWMLYASAVTGFLGLAAVAVEKSLRLARQPGRWSDCRRGVCAGSNSFGVCQRTIDAVTLLVG